MLVKNTYLEIGDITQIVRFDSIDDLSDYLYSHTNRFQVTTVNNKQGALIGFKIKYVNSIELQWTFVDESSVFAEPKNGEIKLLNEDELHNNYVFYSKLPVTVFRWLNSVIKQNMSLLDALTGDNTEYDNSHYTELVEAWLKNKNNQKTFAKAMTLGPNVDMNAVKYINLDC